MLSPLRVLLGRKLACSPNGPSVIHPNSLLRGLRDLCAMLSPLGVFLTPDNRGLLSVIENSTGGE
jgi:hypothetical protein